MKCTDAQIQTTIQENNYNQTKTAKALNISLTTLRKRLRRLGIAPKPSREGNGHKGLTLDDVIKAMHKHKGNRSAASRELDISTPSMYHHLSKIECIGERYNPYVSDLWKAYLKNKVDVEVFNALMEYYTYWVTCMAKQMATKFPNSVDIGDLIQEGCIGLMEAIPKYDPVHNTLFTSYAQMAVRGRILDYLREIDQVPRLVRSKSKKRKKLEQMANMTPELIMEKLGWSEHDYQDSLEKETGSLECILYSKEQRDVRLHETLSRAIEHPAESQFRLAEFTKAMNVEEAIIIYGYYWKDKTMKEIGQYLDLSESRVSQLHSQIMDRLQAKGREAVLEQLCA